MSGGLMSIRPGEMKELHWHPNASEFQYVLKGSGQVALFGSGGRGKVAEVKAGDSAYVPAGYGHAIWNTGSEDLEVLQTWNAGKFEEITLKHWMATAPRYLLANNMAGVPPGVLDKLQA
jgi:oxalate decarboxylase